MTVRAVITGGAGFLGHQLARRLLAGPLSVGGAPPAEVSELIVTDLAEPQDGLLADPRVRAVTGDLTEVLSRIDEADVIFHLAGVVSGAAEADLDLGLRVNVDGLRALLEHARYHRVPPVLVFTSSLAVFGTGAGDPPLGVVDDDTLPRPQSSYGIQKFIGEQLVADYTRRGLVRGRSVRLMTVSVRPGKPNAALSGFMSGIIREPLAGERATCPVSPDMPLVLSSPSRTLDGIVAAAQAGDGEWGSRTALNLPGLSTTPREMTEALDRVAGPGPGALIDWSEDPAVTAIVSTWPARVDTPRAARLGLTADLAFDDIVREYVAGRVTPGG